MASSKKAGKSTGAKPSGSRGARNTVLRRPPAKGLPRLRHLLRCWWRDLLEVSPVWVLLFVLLSTWCLLPRQSFFVPRVEAGTIAARTYIADRDLSMSDQAATRVLQQRAREGVLPAYDFNRRIETERRRQLAELFEQGRAGLGLTGDGTAKVGETDAPDREPPADLLVRLAETSGLKITTPEADLLLQRRFSTELEDRLSGILTRILRQGVVSEKELLLEHRARGITVQELPSKDRATQLDLYRFYDYPEQVREAVEQDLLSWDGLTSRERKAFAALILANVAPNLTPNPSETQVLQDQAAAAVGTVFHTIRKGEVIVRNGGRVDELAARAVDQMAGSRDLTRLLLTGLGTVGLLGGAALLVWMACAAEGRRDRSRERLLSECSMLLVLSILGARFGYFLAEAVSNAFPNEPLSSSTSYAYAIPLASLALVSVLLYGRNLALVLSLVFSLLVGHIAGGEAVWTTIFYALAGSLAAVYVLDHHPFKQRSAMTRAGAIIGLVNGVALLILGALSGEIQGGLAQTAFDLLCGFAGGLLAAAVASFSVPIFENLLRITTSIKLIELANPNLPLLRRLAFEAPGTFQHSLAVANLAKSGVEAIDGDSQLVHTCALYHDVGKIFRPQYFIENQAQMSGPNPHDKIQPSMSALILINHVKEGLELAHHYHLPQPIFDAIEQHHGTHLIRFFYNKAKERSDPETEAVREEEFRYPGPKPQSKEMGVLMLADAVEAASRTLVEPSRQKICGLLQTIFDNYLHDGQLDQADLTLGDLRQSEAAFLRVLMNIYHRRIDYPGFEFNVGGVERQPSGIRPRPAEVTRGRETEPATPTPAAIEPHGQRKRVDEPVALEP